MNLEGEKGVMKLYYNLIFLKKKYVSLLISSRSKASIHVCNPNMEPSVFTCSSRSNSSHRRLVLYKKGFPQHYYDNSKLKYLKYSSTED